MQENSRFENVAYSGSDFLKNYCFIIFFFIISFLCASVSSVVKTTAEKYHRGHRDTEPIPRWISVIRAICG